MASPGMLILEEPTSQPPSPPRTNASCNWRTFNWKPEGRWLESTELQVLESARFLRIPNPLPLDCGVVPEGGIGSGSDLGLPGALHPGDGLGHKQVAALADKIPKPPLSQKNGAPAAIRTRDPQIRNLLLYPTELRGLDYATLLLNIGSKARQLISGSAGPRSIPTVLAECFTLRPGLTSGKSGHSFTIPLLESVKRSPLNSL